MRGKESDKYTHGGEKTSKKRKGNTKKQRNSERGNNDRSKKRGIERGKEAEAREKHG